MSNIWKPYYRAACATDSIALAGIIYLAGKSHYDDSGYDISLGGSRACQLDRLAKLTVTRAESWFHFSHFEVAEVNGVVVAAAAGFEKLRAEAAIPDALREIGWTEEKIQALEERLSETYACFPPEPPGCWTIDHVATVPEWQGRGLARAVLERAIERGRNAGFQQSKLDVFSGNAIARALYEKLGFSLSATFGEDVFPRLLRRGGIARMMLAI